MIAITFPSKELMKKYVFHYKDVKIPANKLDKYSAYCSLAVDF